MTCSSQCLPTAVHSGSGQQMLIGGPEKLIHGVDRPWQFALDRCQSDVLLWWREDVDI